MHMVAEYFLFEMLVYCKRRQGTEGGARGKDPRRGGGAERREEAASVGAGGAPAPCS